MHSDNAYRDSKCSELMLCNSKSWYIAERMELSCHCFNTVLLNADLIRSVHLPLGALHFNSERPLGGRACSVDYAGFRF